jgi:hypothetical protein
MDPNLLAYQFFKWKKTNHLNLKIYNVLSQKFHVLSCYDEHSAILLYDENMSLTKSTTIIDSSVEFITTFFNNTWKNLYIIVIYKPPKMQVSHFNSILKNIIQKVLSHCPIIIIGDFNIEFLTKSNSIINITSTYE